MSAAEIADNKWEVEATKPPLKDVGGVGQIALIGSLGLFFLYVVVMSLVAIVTPKKDGGLADQYKNLNAAGEPAAAPAAE